MPYPAPFDSLIGRPVVDSGNAIILYGELGAAYDLHGLDTGAQYLMDTYGAIFFFDFWASPVDYEVNIHMPIAF